MSVYRPARRVAEISSFRVMDLVDRAFALEAEGRDIVHMEVGEPDFTSAEPIRRAGSAALEGGHTGYTSALGMIELRRGLSDYYRRWHGADVAPERIVITAGATGALVLLSALLMDPGDEVLMAAPGYPCNRQFPRLVEAAPRLVPCGADSRYQLQAPAAAAAWSAGVRGMLLASPANPTGTMLTRQEIAALRALARERDGWIIMDEIYQGLVYPEALEALDDDARHGESPEDFVGTVLADQDDPAEQLFVVNSFSKYFGMTGWRLGWIVAPPAAVPDLEKLAQNYYIAPSTMAQHAGLAALSDEVIAIQETRRRAFCERRNRLVAGLRDLGLGVAQVPTGAFYVFADISRLGVDSETFCAHLLERHGVAATPGTDFGGSCADTHVRFAYTASVERIDTALERLAAAIDDLPVAATSS